MRKVFSRLRMRTPELLLTAAASAFVVAAASLPDVPRAIEVYGGGSDACGWHEEEDSSAALPIAPLRAALVAALGVGRELTGAGLAAVFVPLAFTLGYLNDRRRKAGLQPVLTLRSQAQNVLMDVGVLALVVAGGLVLSLTVWVFGVTFWTLFYSLVYLAIAVMAVFIPVRLAVPALLRKLPSRDVLDGARDSRTMRALTWPRLILRRSAFTRRLVMALGASGMGLSLWYVAHYLPGRGRALVPQARESRASHHLRQAGPYLLDLHAHSSYSDGFYSPGSLIELMIANGFHGCAVSDHNTIRGALETERIAKQRHPQFLVIPGIEFTTPRAHLALLGVRENIQPCGPGVTGRTARGAGSPASCYAIPEAIARVHELGGLVIVAHWREAGLSKEQLEQWGVDGFEVFNSVAGPMDASVAEFCKTHRARAGHRLIMVGSSDTHYDPTSTVANEIDSGELTVPAVLQALREEGRRSSVIIRRWNTKAGFLPGWTPRPLADFIYTLAHLSPAQVLLSVLYLTLIVYGGGALLRVAVLEPVTER